MPPPLDPRRSCRLIAASDRLSSTKEGRPNCFDYAAMPQIVASDETLETC
jgi:hypothetical protein